MKKAVLALALATFLVTGAAFADHPSGTGIGIVGSYGWSWGGGGGLSLKLPSMPIYWALTGWGGTGGFSLHVTGDTYLIDAVIPIPNYSGLHWFLGIGGFFSMWGHTEFYEDIQPYKEEYSYIAFAVGARIPIGVSWQPIPLLEIFLDMAPSLGLGIDTESKVKIDGKEYEAHKGWFGFHFRWPVELGIRLWF